MWEFFFRNSRFTYLLMVTLIGFGVYSVVMIPKESAPEVQVPVGVIQTILPGAPAVDIETLITNEIERGLSGSLSNVKSITSASSEGFSVVTVEFDASADIDSSIQDLKDQVDKIAPELPAAAETPRVTEVDFVDQPIVNIAIAGDLTDREFTELSNQLEIEVESIAGVSRVEKVGVRDREVSVIVTPSSLARYGLTINDVINGIASANNTFPIGQIVTSNISYNIGFDGDIETSAELPDVPVAVRGGQPIYLRDIATIEDALSAANTLSRLSVESEPSVKSISFNIYKQRGGDITRISAAIQNRITELQADNELLSGLTVYTVQDAGADIGSDLSQLIKSGLQTILLVILVLIFGVGWREGLIAGVAIPLSFTIGFIGLYLTGNTINFISLFALILGIGVLVDSGIVMVEGINRNMKDNPTMDKREAARRAISQFSSPLISGTLTTVAVFTGLFIVSGVTGQFIAGIPFTLIFVLFASMLVALGFLPLISASFLRRRSTTKFEQKQLAYAHELESWYGRVLTTILASRSKKVLFSISIIVALFGSIALIPAGLVKVVFFEESDVEAIFVDIELPEGSIKESTDVAVRRVEEILYTKSEVIEAFAVTVGSGNAFAGGGQNEKLANIYVALKDERDISSIDFIEELRGDFSSIRDVKVSVSQLSNGPPTGAPIGVQVLGDDMIALTEVANDVASRLRLIEGVTNVETSNNNNNTEFVFTLDKARTAAYGLNPQIVSQTLRAAVFGTEATTLTTLTDDIDVVVRLNLTGSTDTTAETTNRATIETLENIQLSTPTGEVVLLSSLVTTSLRESSTVINHDDQDRVMSVSADITPAGNVREINAELQRQINEEMTLPSGVHISFGGESEDSNQAFIELFLALIVGIVLMIAVLVLEFNSFRYTLYVLSILPFSLIGILVGLALTGSSLSFPSIMGFIALTGIIVNNSILLIDMMNELRTTHPDMAIRDVVVEAAKNRLRPIILTSLTTIVGMIPLLSSDPIWVPLATAIIFGLTFSIIITLVLIPVIYSKYPGTVRKI